MAKELGIELIDADFTQPAVELKDDELDAVAGGGRCICSFGGGEYSDGSVRVSASSAETETGNPSFSHFNLTRLSSDVPI